MCQTLELLHAGCIKDNSASLEGSSGTLRGSSATLTGGSATLRGCSATPQGGSPTLRGHSATPQGGSATLRGHSATPKGGSATLRGHSATPQGGSATVRGRSATLQGGSANPRGRSAAPQGACATLVSQYAAALHTIAAPQQPTCSSSSRLRTLLPLSHFCCDSPCALVHQPPSIEFDVGSQPHLTPRYTQGVLAMTPRYTQGFLAMTGRHESAHSLASGSVTPYSERLVSRQQAQLCTQRQQQGILADRHAVTGSVRGGREMCAAGFTSRGYSLPKMTKNPPAYSHCSACGRACESQLVGIGRPAAFSNLSGSSGKTLEGSGRTCRDCGRSCRDGSGTWGMNSTGGSLPQSSQAQLAGSTSRAFQRMALRLR